MPVIKIISGGQTGADRMALEVGKMLGLQTGGWAPRGYKTEKGYDSSLKDFGLVCHKSDTYPARTMANVDVADATVAFRVQASTGTDKTIGYAQNGTWRFGTLKTTNKTETKYKPVCIITDVSDKVKAAQMLRQFLEHNQVQVLNVAGHRASSAPVGYVESVKHILLLALQ